jgi:integrase
MWEFGNNKRRHSKRDALNNRNFELLLRGARKLNEYQSLQARFIIFLSGRLGMRKGEITHMTKDWVDWSRSMICVPPHEPCIKGRNSMDICGYCRQNAKQKANHNENLSLEECKERCWVAKTEQAVREIPFDFHPRVSLVIEEFFEKYDSWPVSASAITRRVKKSAENSEVGKRVYPHSLRATAASYHAGRGLGSIPLQSLMGWADISTARNYVQSSGENTARALNTIHSQ